jgi:hypothetical protein
LTLISLQECRNNGQLYRKRNGEATGKSDSSAARQIRADERKEASRFVRRQNFALQRKRILAQQHVILLVNVVGEPLHVSLPKRRFLSPVIAVFRLHENLSPFF